MKIHHGLSHTILICIVLISIILGFPSAANAAIPSVESVDPAFGHQGDDNLFITIYGDNFEASAYVFFENPLITVDGPVNVVDATQLELYIDIDFTAAMGPGDVFVFNSAPEQGGLTDGFTVLESFSPDPQMVTPNQGFTGDSALDVTITGDHLSLIDDVDFGAGITVDNFTVLDQFQINVTISIDWTAIPGFRNVTVFSPYGDKSLDASFEVLAYAAPDIQSIDPDKLCQGDTGVMINVYGSGFLDGAEFSFNPSDVDVALVQWLNDTQVRLFVDVDPLATFGFYDLSTTNPDQQSGFLGSALEVMDCVAAIEAVNPSQGYQADTGLAVTIYGTALTPTVAVDFGPDITVLINNTSPTQIDVSLDIDPLAVVGFRNVTVSTEFSDAVMPNGFEVLELNIPPAIDSIDPVSGNRGEIGYAVTIYGSGLEAVDTVNFGAGISVTILGTVKEFVSCSLDIEPTAVPGFRDVYVENPDGNDTLIDGFEVTLGPPIITNCVPGQGNQDSTIDVTITGFNLDDIVTVDFGAGITTDTFGVISQNQTDATITIGPTATLGYRDVTVTDSQTRFDILSNGFEITSEPIIPPTILSVDPVEGYQGDNNLIITIEGTDFQDGLTVDFNHTGILVTQPFTVTPTSFDFTIDIETDALPGPTSITVLNPDGGEAILINGFTVIEVSVSEITIDSIYPNDGTQGDTNLTITIYGSDFQDGLTVDFNHTGILVTQPSSVNPTSFDVIIDIETDAQIGPTNVTVTNPDDTEDTLFNGFTVLEFIPDEIAIDSISPNQGYRGDILNFQIEGQSFHQDAIVEFLPDNGSFGINYSVVSSTNIAGTIEIYGSAPYGFQHVRVTNPDSSFAELFNGFEVLEEIRIDYLTPSEGRWGDVLDYQITGQGFDIGAIVEFLPVDSFFDITYTVFDSGIINGQITIHEDAPVGFHDVRVTNPDNEFAVLTSGFEVLPPFPPNPTDFAPTEVCAGTVYADFVLYGEDFADGMTVQFEYLGFPTESIYDVSTIFIDETHVNVFLSVAENAEYGSYDIRCQNPDGQYAYGPQLTVIDCGIYGLLEWEDMLLDAFFEYEGLAGGLINETISTNLLNSGEGGFTDVAITMTDLVSFDGLAITPEMVEIWPSFVFEFPGFSSDEININFVIPVSEEFLLAGGGVFMGSLIAKDTESGDMVALPVSITIMTPGGQLIDVDPLCLQVDLYTPGSPSDLIPIDFYESEYGDSEEYAELIGGCYDPFPLFEWGTFASGCPGYMETWEPYYTLAVYPIYPSQSPEAATSNPPVWIQDRLRDTYIQYPLSAEHLNGFYMWQVSVVPVPITGLGIAVAPMEPVLSEIWVFCVEGEAGIGVPEPLIQGEIAWYPTTGTIQGCGMVPATLVLSNEAIADITSGTDAVVSIGDPSGDTLELDLSLAGLQYSSWNPMPEFGPAAIMFGLNVTPNGYVGHGMLPGDLNVQIYNGGLLLGEITFDDDSTGEIILGANVGGASADAFYNIIFPWNMGPCWDVWIEWWQLMSELEDDCSEEEAALKAADAAASEACDALEEANENSFETLWAFVDAVNKEDDADEAYDQALQNCSDFFSEHIDSNNVSYSDPGEGWAYVGAFGGAVDVWFSGDSGASAMNTLLENYGDEYNELWDNQRDAESDAEDAEKAVDEAESAADAAVEAQDIAKQNYESAADNYEAALAALLECLEHLESLQEEIDFLEWLHPECFDNDPDSGTGSGLGGHGLEGGPQLPPMRGDDGSSSPWDFGDDDGDYGEDRGNGGRGRYGEQCEDPGSLFRSDTGIGDPFGPCPCDDCDDEYQALLLAQDALEDAEAILAELDDLYDEALDVLDEAQEACDEAQDAYDEASSKVDELQDKLDTFMEDHVFSDTVGGTPDHGSNHVKFKGVDMYFSSYDDFMNIWAIIKPWITDIANELAEAKDDLDAADEALLDAELELLMAEMDVDAIEILINIAELDVIQAMLELSDAEDAYYDCIEFAELCHYIFGCDPYVPPHLRDTAGGSGEGEDDDDDWEDVEEDPDYTFPEPVMPGSEGDDTGGAGGAGDLPPGQGTGTGELPPGQGTGTGTGEGSSEEPCPCGDCLFEYLTYLTAFEIEGDAIDAVIKCLDDMNQKNDTLSEAQAEVAALEAEIASAAADPDTSDFWMQSLENLLRFAQSSLSYYETSAARAENTYEYAQLIYEIAKLNTNNAWNAYQECLRELEECERANNCPPSEPPGEPAEVPRIPEDYFGPGSDPFDGVIPETDCPCPDCLDELFEKMLTESDLIITEAEWHEAVDSEWELKSKVIELEVEIFASQVEVDFAQETVDELQEKLDTYLDSTVFVDGVGSDPSAGPNSVTYKGVTIYFSDYQMYQTVFNEIKKGIDAVAAQLDDAKASLFGPKNSLEAAQNQLNDVLTALDTASQARLDAWDRYVIAEDAYNQAYDAWLACMMDREDCLDEHPDDCTEGPFLPGFDPETASPYEPTSPYDDILPGINNTIEYAESSLAESEADLADAAEAYDIAVADTAGFIESLNEYFSGLEEFFALQSELIESLPDGAFFTDTCAYVQDGYDCTEFGGMSIVFGFEDAGLVMKWKEDNKDKEEDYTSGYKFDYPRGDPGEYERAQALARKAKKEAEAAIARMEELIRKLAEMARSLVG